MNFRRSFEHNLSPSTSERSSVAAQEKIVSQTTNTADDNTQTCLVVAEEPEVSSLVLWHFERCQFVTVDAKLFPKWHLGNGIQSRTWSFESDDNNMLHCMDVKDFEYASNSRRFGYHNEILYNRLYIKTTVFDENCCENACERFCEDKKHRRILKTCHFGRALDEYGRLPEIHDFASFAVSITPFRRSDGTYIWIIDNVLVENPKQSIDLFLDIFELALRENSELLDELQYKETTAAIRLANFYELPIRMATYPPISRVIISTTNRFDAESESCTEQKVELESVAERINNFGALSPPVELGVLYRFSNSSERSNCWNLQYYDGQKKSYITCSKEIFAEPNIGQILRIHRWPRDKMARNVELLDYKLAFNYGTSSHRSEEDIIDDTPEASKNKTKLYLAMTISYKYDTKEDRFWAPFFPNISVDEHFHQFYACKPIKVAIVYVASYTREQLYWKFANPTTLSSRLKSAFGILPNIQSKHLERVHDYYAAEWDAYNAQCALNLPNTREALVSVLIDLLKMGGTGDKLLYKHAHRFHRLVYTLRADAIDEMEESDVEITYEHLINLQLKLRN